MKKLISSLILLLGCYPSISAQVSMGSIYDISLGVAEDIEKKGHEIVRIEIDVLEQGEAVKLTNRKISGLYSYYQVIAYADKRIVDIDLQIYKQKDGEPILVAEDDTDNNISGIKLSPEGEFEEYIFAIRAEKFAPNTIAGRYVLFFFHPRATEEATNPYPEGEKNKPKEEKVKEEDPLTKPETENVQLVVYTDMRGLGVWKKGMRKIKKEQREDHTFKIDFEDKIIERSGASGYERYIITKGNNERLGDYFEFDVLDRSNKPYRIKIDRAEFVIYPLDKPKKEMVYKVRRLDKNKN